MTNKWKTLILQAEKLLGGPAPFINLSSLLTSEVEFLASRARRLAATVDHPFFSAVRACFQGRSGKYPFLSLSKKSSKSVDRTNVKQRAPGGLVILLAGQCTAGTTGKSSVKLSNHHRKLAEIFETVHLAVTIHKSLIDPKSFKDIPVTSEDQTLSDANGRSLMKDLEAGNKVATLIGDILLASVSTSLAEFHNSHVVDLVSESIGNMFEAEFVPFALNFTHGSSTNSADRKELELSTSEAADQWLNYIGMSHGSLLGSCCQATSLLAETSHTKQSASTETSRSAQLVHGLGYNWAMLLRLLEEREFVQHIWANKIQYASSKSLLTDEPRRHRVLNYVNNGLPEPTFVDALLTNQLHENPSIVAANLISDNASHIFNEYDRLGEKLANNLLRIFSEFSCVSQKTQERASSSALTVLSEMVQELSAEACTSTDLCCVCRV